jgi:hypothetical protein
VMWALASPSSKLSKVGRKRMRGRRVFSLGCFQGTTVGGEVRVIARRQRGSLASVRAHDKGALAPSSAPTAATGLTEGCPGVGMAQRRRQRHDGEQGRRTRVLSLGSAAGIVLLYAKRFVGVQGSFFQLNPQGNQPQIRVG